MDAQIAVLDLLRHAGPLHPHEIRRLTGMRNEAMYEALVSLEACGEALVSTGHSGSQRAWFAAGHRHQEEA